MSYDITLEIDTGGEFLAEVCEVGNHTYNTSQMFFKALGIGLTELSGRNAGETIELLERAVKHMEENADEYTPLNPPNGWGSYDTALTYLNRILTACRKHPKSTISVH